MRILLCGDTPGITQLIGHVPVENIVGIIAASIRPQYLTELASFAEKVKVPIFIQPQWNSSDYAQFKRQILDIAPDIIFVNSYSMIIRDDVLSASTHGGLNVHPAFLPETEVAIQPNGLLSIKNLKRGLPCMKLITELIPVRLLIKGRYQYILMIHGQKFVNAKFKQPMIY